MREGGEEECVFVAVLLGFEVFLGGFVVCGRISWIYLLVGSKIAYLPSPSLTVNTFPSGSSSFANATSILPLQSSSSSCRDSFSVCSRQLARTRACLKSSYTIQFVNSHPILQARASTTSYIIPPALVIAHKIPI
jgi:hypothetical protein